MLALNFKGVEHPAPGYEVGDHLTLYDKHHAQPT